MDRRARGYEMCVPELLYISLHIMSLRNKEVLTVNKRIGIIGIIDDNIGVNVSPCLHHI